jgi:hypothetical protein
LAVLLASISAALLIPHLNANGWSLLEGLSLVAIVVLALIPAIHSWANKTFDLFEPVHMVAFATIISFFLAPILLIGRDQIIIGGVSFRDKLLEAIILAGLALLGFYLGYYLVRQHFYNDRKIGSSEHVVNSLADNQIHKWATLGLLISFVIFLIWFVLANLPLSALNSLSESGYYGLAFSRAETNYVFLFQIRIAWIALLLLAYPARNQNRKYKRTICILWLAVALIFTLSGSRGILFELLIATAIYSYLLKNGRPKIFTLLIAGLVLLIAMGSIVMLRAKNRLEFTPDALSSEVQREITDSGAATGLMVLLTVFPEMNEFIQIQLFEELIIAPIPRALWPEKPRLRGVQNIAERFVPRSHAPPFFGPYYGAFGYAGSILSMAIFGAASGWIYSLWKRNQDAILQAVLLAVWIALLWDLYHRGGLIWSTVKIVYAIGPILTIAWLAKFRNHRNRIKTPYAAKSTTT